MNLARLFFLPLILISLVGCSSSQLMVSSAKESKIVIDGNQDDWSGKLKYFEDERAAVGFQNDEENLYFCLVTADIANAKKNNGIGFNNLVSTQQR